MTGTRRYLIAAVLSILASRATEAQQRDLNLDFEQSSYVRPFLPWGWGLRPFNAIPSAAISQLDSTVRHRGHYSLRLTGQKNATFGFGIFIPIPIVSLAGKRAESTVWVRGGPITNGSLIFRIISADSTEKLHGDSVIISNLSSSTEWVQHRVEYTVPHSHGGFGLSFEIRGEGVVWVDDISIRVAGARTDSIPMEPPRPAAHAEWIRRNATHWERPRTVAEGLRIPKQLDSIFANSRIVGLGEATHGTSEFQTVKRELVEHAARIHGVRVLAIEESQLTAGRINSWIQTAAGDLSNIMADSYNMWRTSEMRELFEWMSRYNRSGQGKLELVGVDVVDIRAEMDSVLTFVSSVDNAYSDTTAAILAAARETWRSRSFGKYPKDSINGWRMGALRIVEHLEQNRARLLALTDSVRFERMLRYAGAIVQGTLYLQTSENDLIARDSMIAANVRRELEVRGGNARMIVWGHNLHIATAPRRMGDFLKRAYGAQYTPIALTTYEGSYSALRPIPGSTPPWKFITVPIGPAFTGSLEELMHRLGSAKLFLDLRPIDTDPDAKWLQSNIRVAQAGIIAADVPSTLMRIRIFDALIYLDRTSPTRILPCLESPRCWYPH